MNTLSNYPALSHYIRQVTQAALASTLIYCVTVTSASATQVNLKVFGQGEQLGGQNFIMQAVEKSTG
jgi:hypothetical protein